MIEIVIVSSELSKTKHQNGSKIDWAHIKSKHYQWKKISERLRDLIMIIFLVQKLLKVITKKQKVNKKKVKKQESIFIGS